MPPTKRSRASNPDDYESDNGFVASDSDAPKSKKAKATSKATTSTSKSKSEPKYHELSSGRQPRRVAVDEFRGMKLVSIREFYEKDGEYLPGRKGISLNMEQFLAFVKAIPQLKRELGLVDDEDQEAESVDEVKPKKERAVKKEKKSNIEVTSDEEEEAVATDEE